MGCFMLILIIIVLSYFLYKTIKTNKELKRENTDVQAEKEKLSNQYAPLISVEEEYMKISKELNMELDKINKLKEDYSEKYKLYQDLVYKIDLFSDELGSISYGLYKPVYDFQTSEEYKQKIDANYEEQKHLIKNNYAVESDTNWIVQGSRSNGNKMIEKEKLLLLKAFNSQCEREIAKVKWNNVLALEEKLNKLYEELNKLGELHDMRISKDFLQLKKDQLFITYEYEKKKYEEKEEQRRIREQMREEEKVQKELEKKQKELEEQERREVELQRLLQEAYNNGKNEEADKYKSEIEKLNEIIESNKKAISNAQLTKWGRIYVISNIGSFGDDVYKIGMTRRDDPMERINELGDASVPFKFDVHAIIESDNAPELENKLHEIFKNKSVNRVNYRKEFFRVSLEDIEKAVREETNSDILFTKIAEAREYRETLSIIQRESTNGEIYPTKEKELLPQQI